MYYIPSLMVRINNKNKIKKFNENYRFLKHEFKKKSQYIFCYTDHATVSLNFNGLRREIAVVRSKNS